VRAIRLRPPIPHPALLKPASVGGVRHSPHEQLYSRARSLASAVTSVNLARTVAPVGAP
jgi:hypothetical protein